ncbi:MAG: asparaginase [bacterium]|nr:asparaginase [bacterium]
MPTSFPSLNSPVRIIVTGGTFDKEYDELSGSLSFTRTHLPDLLRQGRCRLPVRISPLMLIDSLEMTDAHRQRIATACATARERRILITHGTDTMCETARFLAQLSLQKTIVLTGAMIPITFGSSDGLFNLGSALAFVQTLPTGVYIAMNGRCFHAGRVRKNSQTGIFEPLL